MAKEEQKSAGALMVEAFKPDLNNIRPYIERFLPWKGGVEDFFRMTMLAIRRNPKLLEANRDSLLMSLIWCCQKGLEPGVDDGAWLIPFKDKHGNLNVTPIAAYKGLIKKAVDTETVKEVEAYGIYANDSFDYELGTNPHIIHKPEKLGTERGRGDLIGVYAVYTMMDGSKRFSEPLDRKEVEKIRNAGAAWRTSPGTGPWADWEDQMFKKTAIKRGFKVIPVKDKLRDLLYDESRLEGGEPISILLRETEDDLPPGMGEKVTGAAAAKPPDTSEFDRKVKEQLKDLPLEEAKLRAKHLGEWLKDTARTMSDKDRKVTPEMIMAMVAPVGKPEESQFEPFVDDQKQHRPGLWKRFLDEEAKKYPPVKATDAATTGTGVIATENAGGSQGPEVEEPAGGWPDAGPSFEERQMAAWKMYLAKKIPLSELKEKTGLEIGSLAAITSENIAEFTDFVREYEKK